MYRIGEFSSITRLTVKALHYYDSEGMLIPTGRGDNGYRLYSQEDFQRARLIQLLRQLDFSIAEIRDLIDRCHTEGDLRAFLTEKRAQLQRDVQEKHALIRTIDSRLTLMEKAEYKMANYTFEVKEFPAARVASLRTRAPYSEITAQLSTLFKAVKNGAGGAPFSLYYDGEHAEQADIESCVPLKPDAKCSGVSVRTIPAFRALCTTHTGSYDTLNLAYKALMDHASAQGYQLDLPSHEYYLKGPGMLFQGDPDGYVTEIAIPLR